MSLSDYIDLDEVDALDASTGVIEPEKKKHPLTVLSDKIDIMEDVYGVESQQGAGDRSWQYIEHFVHELAHWAALGFFATYNLSVEVGDEVRQLDLGAADRNEALTCAIELEVMYRHLKGVPRFHKDLVDYAYPSLNLRSRDWLVKRIALERKRKSTKKMAKRIARAIETGNLEDA